MPIPQHNQGKEQLSQFFRTFYPRLSPEEMQRVRSGFQQIKTRDPIPRQTPGDTVGDPRDIRLWATGDNGDGGGGGFGSGGGGSIMSGGSRISGDGSGASGSGSGGAGSGSGSGSGSGVNDSGTLGSNWGSATDVISGVSVIPHGCPSCFATICGNGALISCKSSNCPLTNGFGSLLCCATDRECPTGVTLVRGIVVSGGFPLGSDPPPDHPCEDCRDPHCFDKIHCLPYDMICCYDDCSWVAYFGGTCCHCD